MKSKLLYLGLKWVVLIYLALVVFIFFYQKQLVYMPDYPSRELTGLPTDVGLKYEDLELITQDGIELHAWYVPADHRQAVILYCHGNAGNISHRLSTLKIFHHLGYSVLIFDYRGYGKSSGDTSEKGTYLDALAAWDYLVKIKGVSANRIVIYGRSLGAGVATELALHNHAAALILDSAFTSVPDIGAEMYPWFPMQLITTIKYDNKAKVGLLNMPVLVIHNLEDELIPFQHSKVLYDHIVTRKQFLELPGNHNTGRYQTDEYQHVLDEFIRTSIPTPAQTLAE